MALHERLRHARERVGLTQEQVAERIGVSAPSLSAYEKGQREPSFAQLAKLAKVYHRPIEFFVSEEPLHAEAVMWRGKPPSPTAEELETKFLELAGFRDISYRYREGEPEIVSAHCDAVKILCRAERAPRKTVFGKKRRSEVG